MSSASPPPGVSGDLLAAAGIVHALGFDVHDPDIGTFQAAIPKGLRPVLRWRLPAALRDGSGLEVLANSGSLDPAIALLEQAGKIRIEIRDVPTWQTPNWFIDKLGRGQRIKPSAVYLYHQVHPQLITWQWPLRIGFFDNGSGNQLYGKLKQLQTSGGGWRQKILQFDPPANTPKQCGIVLVPSLLECSDCLFGSGNELVCGLLFILNRDGNPDFSDDAFEISLELLEHTWASGVAMVDSADDDQSAALLFETIRNLSHNEPIDSSIVAACRQLNFAYPMIIGSTALMQNSRLSRIAGSMGKVVDNPHLGELPMINPGGSAEILLSDGPNSRIVFNETLRRIGREDNIFEHEGDFSEAMAEVGEAVEAMAGNASEPQKPGPRQLHATVRDDEGNALYTAFQAGQRHEIQVGIGFPPDHAIEPDRVVPFPDEELPADQDDYELTVMFAVLSGEGGPAEHVVDLEGQSIMLPRGSGDSTIATFHPTIPDNEQFFEGRILVLFGNRIMQTGRLSGAIGEPPADGRFSRIRFEIEALVSRYFSGLQDTDRLKYGHALMFNDNPDGQPGLTAVTGGSARISAPQGLDEQFDNFDRLVSTMAHSADLFTGTLDANQDLLTHMIAFARDGADLRHIIERSIPADSRFDSRQPIQIVSKSEGAKIPIEFLYDYAAPKHDAALCPGALESLTTNNCPHDHTRDVFCPSGFWGLNRIIERHEFSATEPDHGFELANEPTATRRTISIAEQALFAGTKVVDVALGADEGLAKIKAELDQLTEQRCVQVQNWDEWEMAIGNRAPTLLVLIVHTATAPPPFREQQMEIGDGQWLMYNDIRTDVVNAGSDSGPILFLVGCKTGSADIRYKTFSEKFKRVGAAIVVGSSATIHSKHAVPVMQRLVQLLGSRADNEEVVFGEIMRRMRCQMLAEGNPIVLCISAYGDADWLLT